MARAPLPLLAGLVTGALLGASLALALTPEGDGTRERLRALARDAEAAQES
jgi:gas vesicle protein